jgi:hypothetical protein
MRRVTCNIRCQTSIKHVCECPCGGRNHGRFSAEAIEMLDPGPALPGFEGTPAPALKIPPMPKVKEKPQQATLFDVYLDVRPSTFGHPAQPTFMEWLDENPR